MADERNILSQPPLTTPIIDQGGNPSKAWAVWFRDIYNRVAYKGGNAIDDNLDLIDGTIDTMEESIAQILKNVIDIAGNAEDIAGNAEDIEINAQNTLYLESRAFGQARPQPYQESGVSYGVGDFVVYPESDPQHYYQCEEIIADPAGIFDPSKWAEKSLRNSIDLDAYLQLTPIKVAHLAFTGRSTNGPATIEYQFNIATLNRTAVGVYEGTLTQNTFYGVDVLDTANPFTDYSLTPNLTTEAFHVDIEITGTGSFTISVFEWVQGAGNKIELVPYDPITAGDLIFVTALADASGGELPPP